MNTRFFGALVALSIVLAGCQQVSDFFSFPEDKKPGITSFTAVTAEGDINGIIDQEMRTISFGVLNPASLDAVTLEFSFIGKVATPGPGTEISLHSPIVIHIEGDGGQFIDYTLSANILDSHDPALEGTWHVTRNWQRYDEMDVHTDDVVADITLTLHPDGKFFRNIVETVTPLDVMFPAYVEYRQERGIYKNDEGLFILKTQEERFSSGPFEEPDMGWFANFHAQGTPYAILGDELYSEESMTFNPEGPTVGLVGLWVATRFHAEPLEYEQVRSQIVDDGTFTMENWRGPDLMSLVLDSTQTGTWSDDGNGVLTVVQNGETMNLAIHFDMDRLIMTSLSPGNGPYTRVVE